MAGLTFHRHDLTDTARRLRGGAVALTVAGEQRREATVPPERLEVWEAAPDKLAEVLRITEDVSRTKSARPRGGPPGRP